MIANEENFYRFYEEYDAMNLVLTLWTDTHR